MTERTQAEKNATRFTHFKNETKLLFAAIEKMWQQQLNCNLQGLTTIPSSKTANDALLLRYIKLITKRKLLSVDHVGHHASLMTSVLVLYEVTIAMSMSFCNAC